MVLDLTRRLAQANPEMDDPAAEAEAVVLIDEIELHLHPGWQRRIVRKPRRNLPEMSVYRDDPFAAGDRRGRARPNSHYGRRSRFITALPFLRRGFQSGAGGAHGHGLPNREREGLALDDIPDNRRWPVRRCPRAAGRTDPADLGKNDPEVTRIQTLLEFHDGRRMRAITKGGRAA